ncbi:SGNH/GDSL hydrolase family protein [Cryptosporangium minutisporangium]|uniref:SGNH/GDSL hydrolase family protein n=1 Tax=Cryptosporangium minutisporangium TaxID=113569 RepID=A0ABP6T3Q9_9ACTN
MKVGRRTVALLLSLASATVLATVPMAASAAPPKPLKYVALGDSYAAAPLVPPADVTNLACLRSLANYPHVAAKTLGARLTDVTCSGAKVGDLSGFQLLTVPQLWAVPADADVISITMGGNDVDLVSIALSCINLLPEPRGKSCADKYTAGGVDQVEQKITAWAPEFGAALDTIRKRAPKARIVVVGYGQYIRAGGCPGTQPIWARDADYLQAKVVSLNAVLRDQAVARGATYLDTTALTAGHDVCAAPADRYIEGLIPASAATPIHPNAAGSKVIGTALADVIR